MAKMTGNRYFAEAMRGYGVSHLFYVNSIAGNADPIRGSRSVTAA